MSDNKNNSNESLDRLPWLNLDEIFQSDKYLGQFSEIPEETYEFAADQNNREFLVNSALNSLKANQPESATREHAEILADMMNVFARMFMTALKKRRA